MVAVSMAHGYYLASGKPAVVMVHSTVGTANALTGLINAARAHVPLVLVAGRTSASAAGGRVPRTLEPHWAQEAADQGGMVRQFAKWDYELRSAGQIEDVVRRAFAIAMSEPRGPVYLVLPMDLMAEPRSSIELREPPTPWGAAARVVPRPAGARPGGGAAGGGALAPGDRPQLRPPRRRLWRRSWSSPRPSRCRSSSTRWPTA